MSRIRTILAREVLDSRGRPTVEAEVHTTSGAMGLAIAPSGAAIGRHEAREIRDGDPSRFAGAGVRRACDHVRRLIAPALQGADPADQETIDQRMLELDGTPDKSRLGANAMIAVSMAAAHAAAAERGLQLYEHIADLAGRAGTVELPQPMVHVLGGGADAGGQLEMRDFLAVPISAPSFRRGVEVIADVCRAVAAELEDRGQPCRLVADQGGFAPALGSNEEAVEVLAAAIVRAGYKPGPDVSIAVDVAAGHFAAGPEGYRLEGRTLSAAGMIDLLAEWCRKHPLVSIEDALAEDDWDGWGELTARLGNRVQLVGDALFATNPRRLGMAFADGVANAVAIKPNQIGTLLETLAVMRAAHDAGYATVVSARSGETEDTTLVHLAVGAGAGQIKLGGLTRSERLAKYNELMRIEDRLLGVRAAQAGGNVAPSPGRLGARRRRPIPARLLAATVYIAITEGVETSRRCFALWLLKDIVGPGGAASDLAERIRQLADADFEPEVREMAGRIYEMIRPGGGE
jgi:enolase